MKVGAREEGTGGMEIGWKNEYNFYNDYVALRVLLG